MIQIQISKYMCKFKNKIITYSNQSKTVAPDSYAGADGPTPKTLDNTKCFVCAEINGTSIAGMGRHCGTVFGEYRRMRLPAVHQLFRIRPEVRAQRFGGVLRRFRHRYAAVNLETVPIRQTTNYVGTIGSGHERVWRNDHGGGRTAAPATRGKSVPVLLQPSVPRQSGSRV